jgi:polyisoprenoid-binding protein YceI
MFEKVIMSKKRFLSLFVVLTPLFAFIIHKQKWEYIKNNASVRFFVIEKTGEEEGVFKGLLGGINFDENDLKNSSINAIINTDSIDTGIPDRDKELRSKDFFETKKFPTLSFISSYVYKSEKGFCADGLLKIKNVEKKITLPFSFTSINDSTGLFKGNFTINRLDYGVGTKEDGIGNMVRIELAVSVVKK